MRPLCRAFEDHAAAASCRFSHACHYSWTIATPAMPPHASDQWRVGYVAQCQSFVLKDRKSSAPCRGHAGLDTTSTGVVPGTVEIARMSLYVRFLTLEPPISLRSKFSSSIVQLRGLDCMPRSSRHVWPLCRRPDSPKLTSGRAIKGVLTSGAKIASLEICPMDAYLLKSKAKTTTHLRRWIQKTTRRCPGRLL